MIPNQSIFNLFVLIVSITLIGKCVGQVNLSNRPPYTEYAKMVRYLVHKSNWTSMGTISTVSPIQGFPMVNIKSIADSAVTGKSTGHIYFLLTDLDLTGKDINQVNKCTAMFTEDQDLSCLNSGLDTQEPKCARAILTGKVERLNENSDEYANADEYFTDRHPASVNWRKQHNFYFCKLQIEFIVLIDFYGGARYVSVDDYYNANYDAVDSGNEHLAEL
ncbi:protein CREG1-like [Contarinia nasturtii]|uniref:protein CREG1-like n=1 Tax=Contarinia nasturtii TaxID=265458 RepID=UPI0012D41102|nr:protein CREG1-like [Contarinia nasturtii]